jgi:adhesin transport system outer membrane protein
MSAATKSLSLTLLVLLFAGTAFSADQISVQKSVIDTLRYAPRLEMIKQNRQAVGHDLEKSKGRWYPKIDARGGV